MFRVYESFELFTFCIKPVLRKVSSEYLLLNFAVSHHKSYILSLKDSCVWGLHLIGSWCIRILSRIVLRIPHQNLEYMFQFHWYFLKIRWVECINNACTSRRTSCSIGLHTLHIIWIVKSQVCFLLQKVRSWSWKDFLEDVKFNYFRKPMMVLTCDLENFKYQMYWYILDTSRSFTISLRHVVNPCQSCLFHR